MSRLLENSELIRNELLNRNLYNPNDNYHLDSSKLINSINKISNVIAPFSSFDLSNTVYGRLIGTHTPLAKIALTELSKQFLHTIKSNASAEYLPSISVNNLFDGNPNTKFITKKVDFQITRRESQSSIGKFIEEITNYTSMKNPFDTEEYITDSFIIKNTGIGQLGFLIKNLNRNFYKQSNSIYLNSISEKKLELNNHSSVIENNNLKKRFNYLFNNNDNFNFPYASIGNDNIINEKIKVYSELKEFENHYEYGISQSLDYYGKTNLNKNILPQYIEDDPQLDSDNYGFSNSNDEIILGLTGADEEYIANSIIYGREGLEIFEGQENIPEFPADNNNQFNVRLGLLKYNQELINSTGGKNFIDQTKKFFRSKDGKTLHFQGSPITKRPDGTIDKSRQHNKIDQYNRFSKAIRFNGNHIYNGNKNSTINKTVIPKFHPILNEDNTVNIDNMMFSIENLAFLLNSNGDMGDEFNTTLPLSEVGPNFGRIMWFAPYDVHLSESAIARNESVQFIGRTEPIYNYSNSERVANLSFKLIIDHPPQVKGRNHANSAQFFAFGDPRTKISFNRVEDIDKKIKEVEDELNDLSTVVNLEPSVINSKSVDIFFPNDAPKIGDVNTAVSNILSGVDFGDNKYFGYQDGISQTTDVNDLGKNAGKNDEFKAIINEFLNKDTRDYVEVKIEAAATKLYIENNGITQSDYNKKLSERRVESVVSYLNDLIKTELKETKTLTGLGVPVIKNSLGSIMSSNEGGFAENINTDTSINERYCRVTFQPRKVVPTKEKKLTPEEIELKNKLQNELDILKKEKNEIKKENTELGNNPLYNVVKYEDKYYTGFEAIERNVLRPCFFSQTPEDFHRRLTFLQQCTRPGKATRKSNRDENGNVISMSSKNSVFGRPPVCVLRVGDFFHTKIVIDQIQFEYGDTWDLNPEGMGMQFMIADITIQMRVIGGQSLASAIDVLQNAESFNYYANSTFYNTGVYKTATEVENKQINANKEINKNKEEIFKNR